MRPTQPRPRCDRARQTPTPKLTPRPIALLVFANMLHNPYYIGVVRWRGVDYEGRHEPIVTPELFERVQEVCKPPLASRTRLTQLRRLAHRRDDSIAFNNARRFYGQAFSGVHPMVGSSNQNRKLNSSINAPFRRSVGSAIQRVVASTGIVLSPTLMLKRPHAVTPIPPSFPL